MRLRERARPSLAAVGVAALVLAGCAQSPTATGGATPAPTAAQSTTTKTDWTIPREMPAGKGSDKADGVFPRTVAHFQGETTLAAAPAKVVVISTGQADVLLSLGIVPVGSTSGDGADMIPKYLFDAFPAQKSALESVTYVGSRFDPNIEAIANLKPDLIVMNNAGKDAQALYTALSAIGPTVASQGTGLYWKQDFLLLADALGKREQAQTWLDAYHADAAKFGASVQGNPTISFLRKNGDRTRVFGVASFSGSVAEDAGLARPESQSFTKETSIDISAEQLEKADATWIFYGVQGGKDEELTSFALWPTLTAVSKNQAVSVDDDVFYLNVGPTAARGILAKLTASLG